jgi:hypothetical protein
MTYAVANSESYGTKMLQVYYADKGNNNGGGGFIEAAFCGDKPVGVLCKVQGGVFGFYFSFNSWEIGIGRNIVD